MNEDKNSGRLYHCLQSHGELPMPVILLSASLNIKINSFLETGRLNVRRTAIAHTIKTLN